MATSAYKIEWPRTRGRGRGGAARLAALGLATALVLVGCGVQNDDSTTGTEKRLSEAEFVARADRICADAASHFDELPDPDGEGGAKPLGVGTFMRAWVVKLREPQPPREVADDWKAGLDLLDRAAGKLDDAEAGDPEAQGEALWDLEARAQQRFDAMRIPFRVCFVE